MGAWGLGLFDSDHDLDLIGDIGDDAELELLEPKIRERLETTHSAHVEAHRAGGKEDEPLKCDCVEEMVSIYPSLRPYENKDLVRQHLENPDSADGSKSRATSLVEKYRSELKSGNDIRSAWGPGYKLILLGVCYMELGMVLPAGLRDTMRRIYRVVGLMRDALVRITFPGDGAATDTSARSRNKSSTRFETTWTAKSTDLSNTRRPKRTRYFRAPS